MGGQCCYGTMPGNVLKSNRKKVLVSQAKWPLQNVGALVGFASLDVQASAGPQELCKGYKG